MPPKGYTKYKHLIEYLKANPCDVSTKAELICKYKLSHVAAFYIVRNFLSDHFTVVGKLLISRCALEQMKRELRSFIYQISRNGVYVDKMTHILNKICMRKVSYPVNLASFHEFMKMTFPDATIIDTVIHITNAKSDEILVPATIRRIFCVKSRCRG